MIDKSVIKTIKETDYYKKVKEVINELNNDGLLDRGVGYCLSMSDIVMKLLYKKGIECDLVECTVMIEKKRPPELALVGYEGLSNVTNFRENMETHIVCITKTPVPLLIDASLKHIDPNVPCVCIPVVSLSSSNNNLAEYDFGTSIWTYQRKSNSKFPLLHQQSILERISTDSKFRQEIKYLKIFLIAISVITSLNFIRGTFDFYQKYINETNNFGPTRVLD